MPIPPLPPRNPIRGRRPHNRRQDFGRRTAATTRVCRQPISVAIGRYTGFLKPVECGANVEVSAQDPAAAAGMRQIAYHAHARGSRILLRRRARHLRAIHITTAASMSGTASITYRVSAAWVRLNSTVRATA